MDDQLTPEEVEFYRDRRNKILASAQTFNAPRDQEVIALN